MREARRNINWGYVMIYEGAGIKVEVRKRKGGTMCLISTG